MITGKNQKGKPAAQNQSKPPAGPDWANYQGEEKAERLALDIPFAQAIGIQVDAEKGIVVPGFYWNKPCPWAETEGDAVSTVGSMYNDGYPSLNPLPMSVLAYRQIWPQAGQGERQKSKNQLLVLVWWKDKAYPAMLTAPGIKGEELKGIQRWADCYATDVGMATRGKSRPPADFFRFDIQVGKARREENADGIKYTFYPFEINEQRRDLDKAYLPVTLREDVLGIRWIAPEWKRAWSRKEAEQETQQAPAGSDELAKGPANPSEDKLF